MKQKLKVTPTSKSIKRSRRQHLLATSQQLIWQKEWLQSTRPRVRFRGFFPILGFKMPAEGEIRKSKFSTISCGWKNKLQAESVGMTSCNSFLS